MENQEAMDGFWWTYMAITIGLMWFIALGCKDLIEEKRLMMIACISPIVFTLLLLISSGAGGFVVEGSLSLNKNQDKITTLGMNDQEFANFISISAGITSILTLLFIVAFSTLLILEIKDKAKNPYATIEKLMFICVFLGLYIYSFFTLNLYI